jgi:hypothetical protein
MLTAKFIDSSIKHEQGRLNLMPVYLQIILLIVAFVVFVGLAMLATGWGVRRVCFKIIADLEEQRAFSEKRAIKLPDERRNFFRVGTGNLRPKALRVLIADGLVIKTGNGKYYLDQKKVAAAKSKTGS